MQVFSLFLCLIDVFVVFVCFFNFFFLSQDAVHIGFIPLNQILTQKDVEGLVKRDLFKLYVFVFKFVVVSNPNPIWIHKYMVPRAIAALIVNYVGGHFQKESFYNRLQPKDTSFINALLSGSTSIETYMLE